MGFLLNIIAATAIASSTATPVQEVLVLQADGSPYLKEAWVSQNPSILLAQTFWKVEKGSGKFEIDALLPGPTRLYLFEENRTTPAAVAFVQISESASAPLELRVHSQAVEFQGRISRLGESAPAQFVHVQGVGCAFEVRTDKTDGTFQVRVPFPGHYHIQVGTMYHDSVDIYAGMPPWTVEVPVNSVRCTLPLTTPEATLALFPIGDGHPPKPLRATFSSPQNTATLRYLKPGPYWATCSVGRRTLAATRVEVPEIGRVQVEFPWKPYSKLFVTAKDGTPTAKYSIQGKQGHPLPSTEEYPAGEYRVYVTEDGQAGMTSISLEAGQEQEVSVATSPSAQLTVMETSIVPMVAYLEHESGYRFHPALGPPGVLELNFRNLPPGEYQLMHRPLGLDWNSIPLTLAPGEQRTLSE